MKQFDKASEYGGYELLYKAKAEYYEKLCAQLVEVLEDLEYVHYSVELSQYYCDATGEVLGEDL